MSCMVADKLSNVICTDHELSKVRRFSSEEYIQALIIVLS